VTSSWSLILQLSQWCTVQYTQDLLWIWLAWTDNFVHKWNWVFVFRFSFCGTIVLASKKKQCFLMWQSDNCRQSVEGGVWWSTCAWRCREWSTVPGRIRYEWGDAEAAIHHSIVLLSDIFYVVSVFGMGAHGGAVGGGTALQAERSQVRFLMVSLEILIDIILLATLWPWGWFSLQEKQVPGILS